MTGRLSLFAALLGAGCSEREYHLQNLPSAARDLRISGQVCDPVTGTWLPNALVYTHLSNDGEVVYDSRSAVTDAEGRYTLTDLIAGRDYEIYVQVGHDVVEQFVLGLGNEDVAIPPAPCRATVGLEVAVITGAYDDLQPILEAVGVSGARKIDGQSGTELVDFLTDPNAMAAYDAIFFDGGHREDGVVYGSGPVGAVHDALRSYVRSGGVVFASDWAYDVVEQVWPEQLDFAGDDTLPDAAQIGEAGVVEAAVIDPELAGTIATDEVAITYDLPVWPVIEEASPTVEVFLEGEARWRIGLGSGTEAGAPLLVAFDDGAGRVLFSTYRYSANNTPEMRAVLGSLTDRIVNRE